MSKRLTLAQQLAQISEPAPLDLDPEDSYATYGDERRQDSDGELDDRSKKTVDPAAAGRADYFAVGQSKLRKKGEAVLDAKYEGKKGSRAALYGDDDESDASDDDEEDGDSEGMDAELNVLLNSGEDYESVGGEGGFEDLEADGDAEATSYGPGGAAAFDSEEDEEDEEEEEAPKKEVKKAPLVSKDDRAMVKQLKQAASADVEKGRDVKKQLAFADSLLSSRIALQRAVQAANALPTPQSNPPASVYLSADDVNVQAKVEGLWAELVECSEELFELRANLLSSNESILLPSDDFGSSRKRKRADIDDDVPNARQGWLDATLGDLKALEASFDPFLRTTVTKWSDKVLAASGLSLKSGGADKKFKAVNQNAMQQIDHALSASTGERDRLVKRTRVRRTTEGVGARVLGGGGKRGEGEEEEGDVRMKALEGEEGRTGGGGKKELEEECFDDSDWYGQVLRDLVESRMLDLDDVTLTSLRTASAYARGKTVKKQVDTRASKGRKIRYHVHEKAQSFMIPVEAGHWHDEQIDELFASILGRSFPQQAAEPQQQQLDPALDDVEGQRVGEVEVGSLRLF
ncbi:hypothetical protein JCM8547_006742 [Rhodosporidiobolus lusitaniae]